MSSLNPLHAIESKIIELIAANKGLSVRDLHTELSSVGVDISLNALYKPLNRMLDLQMLVKTKGELFINNVWLQHVVRFVNFAQVNHASSTDYDIKFPLQEGQRYDYTADCLQGLDIIWNHALVKLSGILKGKHWHVYNSHPWYSIGMRDTERRLYEGIIHQGKSVNILYGNNSYLDEYGSNLIVMDDLYKTINTNASFPKNGHAIWICNDHIVECVMPEIIARNFLFYFESVKKISEFNQQQFTDVFKMKSRCKISIRCNKKEAEKLQKLF